VVPDVICLAKAIGGGTPCGAIGATEELFGPVLRAEYDMAGTFNGNPLTMAASRVALTEVLVPEALNEQAREALNSYAAAVGTVNPRAKLFTG